MSAALTEQPPRGLTLIINVGGWGGVYIHRQGFLGLRVCLGFIAFTIMPGDIDWILEEYCELKEAANARAAEEEAAGVTTTE